MNIDLADPSVDPKLLFKDFQLWHFDDANKKRFNYWNKQTQNDYLFVINHVCVWFGKLADGYPRYACKDDEAILLLMNCWSQLGLIYHHSKNGFGEVWGIHGANK